jgi:radical SAM protein with 4Fe4S-binding SPASM domain
MDKVYACGAGQTSFTVDPYGKLQLCQLSRRKFFDLSERPFAEGWNEYFPKLRAREWQTNAVCRSCSLISLCGSCPGASEMETGDIEGLVPQFCELAHIRAWEAMDGKSGHRRDATCCLGEGKLASVPPEQVQALLDAGESAGGGCGCGDTSEAPLIRLQRRPANPAL